MSLIVGLLALGGKAAATHFGHAAVTAKGAAVVKTAAAKTTAAKTAAAKTAAAKTAAAKTTAAKTTAAKGSASSHFGSYADPNQLTSYDISSMSPSDLQDINPSQIDDYNLRSSIETAQQESQRVVSDPSYSSYHAQQASDAAKNAQYYADS